MKVKIKLVLFLVISVLTNEVFSQDAIFEKDSIAESFKPYKKLVFSHEVKYLDALTSSYMNITDFSIYDSIYCEFVVEYIEVTGFMENCSKIDIGDNLCDFMADKCIGLKSDENSFLPQAILEFKKYGDNHILFQYSLITGPSNGVWYYFERKPNKDTLPKKKIMSTKMTVYSER